MAVTAVRLQFAAWQWMVALALVLAAATGAYFSVEVRIFLLFAVVVPPIVVLPLFIYGGEVYPLLRIPAAILWTMGMAVLALVTIWTVLNAVLPPAISASPNALMSWSTIRESLSDDGARRLGIAAIWTAISIAASLLAFTPLVRRAAARVLPLNPQSFVHAIVLASVIGATGLLVIPTAVLGEPPALRGMADNPTFDALKKMPSDQVLRIMAYLYFWGTLSLLCFVGFPMVRTFRGALRRLGLVWPTLGQWLLAFIATGVLVPASVYVVDPGVGGVWNYFGWPRTDENAIKGLFDFATSPWGAVTVGICAGVSEEIFVRGALQPRLGIVVSNVLFAALHASQYNFDALTSVFITGIVLGVIRRATNTTTTVVIHGLFDFTLLYGMYRGWF